MRLGYPGLRPRFTLYSSNFVLPTFFHLEWSIWMRLFRGVGQCKSWKLRAFDLVLLDPCCPSPCVLSLFTPLFTPASKIPQVYQALILFSRSDRDGFISTCTRHLFPSFLVVASRLSFAMEPKTLFTPKMSKKNRVCRQLMTWACACASTLRVVACFTCV